jgi:uncharacterized membrane protein YqaE (UPF0057 family)
MAIIKGYAVANQLKEMIMSKLILIVVAILLPPLAVLLKKGIGMPLLINIVLTLLFYLPGLIHALMVVTKD